MIKYIRGKYELLLYVEFTMTTLLSPFMFHMSMGFLPFVSSSSPSLCLIQCSAVFICLIKYFGIQKLDFSCYMLSSLADSTNKEG
ncbi:hypothetical protein YC2023_032385 [Brassica napus]